MKKVNSETINKMLNDVKLRKTKPRAKILEVLLNSSAPLTQEQIAAKLENRSPDKVTIYRCLANFVETELVHRAFLQDRIWHYELSHHCTASQCHPHFTCTKCGVTKCLWGMAPPLVTGLQKGYVINRQQVRLEGLCPNCS